MILHEVYGEGGGRGTLANVASTSKAFYPGAIAILWREMECLTPLVDLIPRNVWDYVRGERDPKEVRGAVTRLSVDKQLTLYYIRHGNTSSVNNNPPCNASNGTASTSRASPGFRKRIGSYRKLRRSSF